MKCPHCKATFDPSAKELDMAGDRTERLAEMRNWYALVIGIIVIAIFLIGAITYYSAKKYDSPQYQSESRRRWSAELEGLRQYLHEVDERLSR